MATFSCGNIENLLCLTGIKSCKFTKLKQNLSMKQLKDIFDIKEKLSEP